MKKTFKLSVPYLGKAVVVTVVSFSCAISAYQLYQNSSIFSPQSQALDLKNNQVVFSNQNQQTNTNQNQDESQYLNENQQALDKISQTNFNNSPYLKIKEEWIRQKFMDKQVWGQMVAIR